MHSWRDVHPVVEKSYAASAHTLTTSSAFYVQSAHPQVVSLSKQLYRFWTNHLAPALARAYSVYVRPQVDKLMGKIFKGRAYQMSTEAVREAKEGVRKASGDASYAASKSANAASSSTSQAATGKAPQSTEQAAVKETDESADEREAKVTAEGDVLREKLEMWEDGMTELIRKEYKLWTERIAEMVSRKLPTTDENICADPLPVASSATAESPICRIASSLSLNPLWTRKPRWHSAGSTEASRSFPRDVIRAHSKRGSRMRSSS